MLRENPRRYAYTPPLQEPISNTQIYTFVFLQLADIYTTYRGLQYDCVYEANPLLGEKPSVGKMFATKFAVLTPAFEYDKKNGNLSPRVLNEINALMTIVILNNTIVTKKAEKNCKKV